MGEHINADGEFQSDKYPTCPPGKVPLSVKDKTAQDLLWEYAQRRRKVDAGFSDDLELALRQAGYVPAPSPSSLALKEGENQRLREAGIALVEDARCMHGVYEDGPMWKLHDAKLKALIAALVTPSPGGEGK